MIIDQAKSIIDQAKKHPIKYGLIFFLVIAIIILVILLPQNKECKQCKTSPPSYPFFDKPSHPVSDDADWNERSFKKGLAFTLYNVEGGSYKGGDFRDYCTDKFPVDVDDKNNCIAGGNEGEAMKAAFGRNQLEHFCPSCTYKFAD